MFRAKPKTVIVTKPLSLLVDETISVSGRLRGQTESNIGATNGGRVAMLFVREGDSVLAGQVIAQMDNDILSTQIAQAKKAVQTMKEQINEAESAIETAKAQYLQASRPPLKSDVERLRADNEQSIRVGKAKLDAAKQRESAMYQRYVETKSGPRQEALDQAQSQVQQAEASLTQQEREWNRQQALYKKDFVPRAEVERAETNYLVAKKSFENTRSKLLELKNGNRAEVIAQAEADYFAAKADVASAEASLHGARKSGEAQLKSLLAMPRPEDILVAEMRVKQAKRSKEVVLQRLNEAETALILAHNRYSETKVKAPFAGTITQIVTEIGAIAGPSAPIVRLVRTGKPEIQVELDESNLRLLKVGQEALVTNDAFPDKRFKAKVSNIGAQVDTDRGTIEVKLVPIAPPSWARPGQTFTVNILMGDAKKQLIVPTNSVSTNAGISSLFVVENGKAVKKSVKAAPMSTRGVPILEGITPETQIITDPVGLNEGESVIARTAK